TLCGHRPARASTTRKALRPVCDCHSAKGGGAHPTRRHETDHSRFCEDAMKTARQLRLILLLTLLYCAYAFAGGPINVTNSPGTPLDGKPYTWDPAAMPIKYTVDPGPMSSSGGQVIVSNASGLQRVAQMFQSWQNVPTAALSYSYAGPILATSG